MTTDKETPYWEQDIAECLRVAAEIIGPNSYYLRAAEYIEEMRDRTSNLEREAAALRADLDDYRKYRQEADAAIESLRADRDALAVELGDAIAFMQQAADLGILNAEECAPILQQYKQALAAHAGKP